MMEKKDAVGIVAGILLRLIIVVLGGMLFFSFAASLDHHKHMQIYHPEHFVQTKEK